jgi:pyruvate formate-lyase/glycerol dehydratase family glycyl radical enzyme
MARIYNKSAEESLDYLLTNDMSYTGNMSYLTKFSYMTSIITGGKKSDYQGPENRLLYPISDIDKGEKRRKLKNEILGRKVDNVQVLEDPYLGKYSIDDFPRLRTLKNRRFALKPAICIERARLITEFHRKNGFEVDAQSNPFDPNLRQAMAINHIMVNRKPIIHDRHLLAGSTTSKEVGVPIYPEFIGTTIWPELRTISNRKLNPNDLSDEDADILNFEVFPYWMDRNVREYCRTKYGNPVSQQLEERFVLYFMMKNNAISHTVPGFKKVLTEGLRKIQQDALELERAASPEKKNFYKAVQIVTEGAMTYATHLSEEALRIAATLNPADPDQLARINELKEIARICAKVPANPADSVYEAVMAIWLSFVCLHSENANSALSIGRLDQMLQPYFLKEIAAAGSDAEKEEIIKRSIELVGSLFLRFNDDDPLMPNVGNKLFGGSSSDDTVTVGGVDQEGNTAVCDMTFIVLKAAEMLCFQDPNMNARYYPGVNSEEYLRRLCEVNINMAASPSLHNDKQMIDALVHQGIPIEDARDWAATGCVEPTISGKHYGHTNCMLVNMVAPLEAALNDGIHPVMGERIGPQTGEVRTSFPKYDDFLQAYKIQLKYLIDQSIEINNDLGVAHQYIHPTPLLSAMTTGPFEKGKDIIYGGATYNTSGVAMVSITDAVDSLYVIKKLIYERQVMDFPTLMNALEKNFDDGYGETLLKINKVPKFGSGEEEPIMIAQDLINFCYDAYQARDNYRGGKYLPGYWSISYHVGFGMLSGALPSGRKKGKAFTPGLTPAPGASDQLIQNIHSVAALDHLKMPNNIAFNVKLVPHAGDSHEQTLNNFTSYVQSYFEEGGMQWQFNIITTDMMREAMDHPEDYRWLIVRISGYNAYFVKLNRNMQIELIERTEFQTA